MEDFLLKYRQGVAPSHVLLEMKLDIKEIKETLVEVVEQVKKTNGRVSALEYWKNTFDGFTQGVKAGGRGVWVGIVTVIGLGWIVFGDVIKRKLGL